MSAGAEGERRGGMKAMTVKQFDELICEDFGNGAILDAIRQALKEREYMLQKYLEGMSLESKP